MASNPITIQQVLADAALPLQGANSGPAVVDQLGLLIDQMQRLQTIQQAVADATLLQTQVIKTNVPTTSTATKTADGDGIGGTLLNVVGSGLGLSPLISGILRLFGGDDSSPTTSPSVKFSLPSSVSLNAGVSDAAGRPFGVDYGQGGAPRPVTTASSQVTVQVNAMDSRSFLDHSNDIAMAVRQAMLESSVLSDVIREV
jgi:hypothetical protein